MPEGKKLQAERLIKLRTDLDLTRQTVAADLNIDQTTYGKYELGQRQPSVELLVRLAAYYKVTTDYLLGFSDLKNGGEGAKEDLEKDSDFMILRRASSKMTPEQRRKAVNILKASFDDFDWEE